MGAAIKVVGALAILKTESGTERYMYHGAIIGQGFKEESVEHALSVGLLAEVEIDEVEESGDAAGEKVEFPSKDWNHARIDAWAGELDPPVTFDPEAKQTKEQKLEVLAPQIDAAKAAADKQ